MDAVDVFGHADCVNSRSSSSSGSLHESHSGPVSGPEQRPSPSPPPFPLVLPRWPSVSPPPASAATAKITSITKKIVHLRCAVQRYGWGRPAAVSEVAQLARANGVRAPEHEDEDVPYAELRVGVPASVLVEDGLVSHCDVSAGPAAAWWDGGWSAPAPIPSGSSGDSSGCLVAPRPRSWLPPPERTDPRLDLWMAQHPEALGAASCDQCCMMSVRSVRTTTSLHAHPDAERAARLNGAWPRLYPNAQACRHVTVALRGGMDALYGFAPPAQLIEMLLETPEMCELLGARVVNALLNACFTRCVSVEPVETAVNDAAVTAALRAVVQVLLRASRETVAQTVTDLAARTDACQRHAGGSGSWATIIQQDARLRRAGLVSTLHHHHPGDVGVLLALFLNHVHLAEGDALVVAPNTLHAYLAGEMIECSTTADGPALRAGLTHKFRDVEELMDALNYASTGADASIIRQPQVAKRSAHETRVTYAHAHGDDMKRSLLEVTRVSLRAPAGTQEQDAAPAFELEARDAAQLMLIQAGSGRLLEDGRRVSRGAACLIPAAVSCRMQADAAAAADEEPIVAWVATHVV